MQFNSILSSCLTVSMEGIGSKVEDRFFLFEGILGGEAEVTIGRFYFTIGSFWF